MQRFCVWCGDEVDGKMSHSACVAPILGLAEDHGLAAQEAENLALDERLAEVYLRLGAESLTKVASGLTVP